MAKPAASSLWRVEMLSTFSGSLHCCQFVVLRFPTWAAVSIVKSPASIRYVSQRECFRRAISGNASWNLWQKLASQATYNL